MFEHKQYSNISEHDADIFQCPECFFELCQIACKVLDGTTAAFALTDKDKSWLPVWFRKQYSAFAKKLPLFLTSIQSAATMCVPDVNALPDDTKVSVMKACGIRAYIVVPLALESECLIGSFIVTFDVPQKFTAEEIFLMQSFSRMASSLLKVSSLKNDNEKNNFDSQGLLNKIEDLQNVLKRNDRMLKHVSHLAKIGAWEYNLIDQTIHWSDQVYEIHEVLKGTIIELSEALNFYPPDARAAVTKLMRHTINTGEPFEFELSITTALGNHRIVRSLGDAEIKDHKVVRVFGTFQDITQQREMESQAAQLIKLDTFGQLTGGIAHDFNNILSSVIGNLQLYLRRSDQSSQDHEEVDNALRSAQRGSKLVGRLLSFVRSRDLVIEPFEVHNVVHELEDLLREACGSHVKLLLDIKDTSWSVATDVSQFETALLNLVINAKDASSEEGVIKITVDNVGAGSQGECNKNSAIPNQYVCISVVDTGSGIPKSIIDKITEPFFTTKEVGKGTGLGLSLVKSIVTSSGGILDIESEEGVGTTVSILLPRFKKTPIIETVAEVETRVDAEQRSAQSGV